MTVLHKRPILSSFPVLQQNNTSRGSLGFIFEICMLHVGGECVCVISWVSECLEEGGNEEKKIETEIEAVCVCVYEHVLGGLSFTDFRVCVWLSVGLSCV